MQRAGATAAALGSSRCELPGMHSVPKSAVLPYASGVGGLSRRLLNRATPYVAAPATALALLWGKRPCRRPRFIGPPFLPGRSRGRSASGDVFLQEIPPQERISSAPRRLPEKHHEHRFAQHLLSKIQRADVRLLGGYLRQE